MSFYLGAFSTSGNFAAEAWSTPWKFWFQPPTGGREWKYDHSDINASDDAAGISNIFPLDSNDIEVFLKRARKSFVSIRNKEHTADLDLIDVCN